MKTEIPQFKRCCFCVPLRHGLLVWGYIKMVIAILSLVLVVVAALKIRIDSPEIAAVFAVAIILCLLDISFNIVFIVGCHKKNFKLLRVYYYVTLTGVVVYALLYFAYFVLQVIYFSHRVRFGAPSNFILIIAQEATAALTNILIQGYLLLLIRSEVIKLRANCRFQFVNNAAEEEGQIKGQYEEPKVTSYEPNKINM